VDPGPPYDGYVYGYLAFDSFGNLWVTVDNRQADPEVHQIVELSQTQFANLAVDDEPIPVFTINETPEQQAENFPGWGAIAFDSAGNLWAGASGPQPNLFRFSPASLADGGLPDIAIGVPTDASLSLAFDPIPPGLPLQQK